MKMKEKQRNKPLVIIAILLLVAGVGVILYPYILQWQYNGQAHTDYEEFVEKITENSADAISAAENKPSLYPELLKKMQAYNEKLYTDGQKELSDPWAYQQASFNLAEYGFDENVIGYIEVPKIKVVLPIYLGASEENMVKGAVHMSQTSLPIGGSNTNCVICAHRGYYGAEMFKNLVDLTEGDEVIVTNLWETMTYKVTDTTTILYNEADKLKIQDGKEMLTLFTCYDQSGRKDRFVLYCERVSK